jgi:peptidoglycan/LPS O-acetylase OafA/YrhL
LGNPKNAGYSARRRTDLAMNKQFSRYLDLLRIVAALLVLFAHLTDPTITDGAIKGPNQIGYSAVMVFFVLSGYVISYVAVEREFTLSEFVISRIARVYSVVIPALALTVLVDLLFLYVRPLANANELIADIPLYQYAKFPKYIVMDLLFGNQLWGLRATAFTNGAYWSMCLEVYFYILFAAAFYLRGGWRITCLLITLLVIGPWALLRFHLWLFGCAVYWLHRNRKISVAGARLLFLVTIALMIFYLATDFNLRIDDRLDLWTSGWVGNSFLRRFVGDTLTGLTIALNIFAARYAALDFGRFGWWFTYLASFTFSLYLMHTPLLRFWSGYWHPGPFLTVAAVLASVWLLGQLTEKHKDHLRNVLRRDVASRLRWVGSSGA